MLTLNSFILGLVVSLAALVACVLIHYEGLNVLERFSVAERRWFSHARGRIVLVMVGVVLLHALEIWLFAGLYAVMEHNGLPGTLKLMPGAPVERGLLDYVYYSSVVYTTLGLGDLVPTGIFRIVSGSEALFGLLLTAWSASFTYLLMQRLWGRGRA
jgi:hypothetical protein